MIHDRGRIWLNPCRDRIGQFGSYLRGIAKRQYDENEVAAVHRAELGVRGRRSGI